MTDSWWLNLSESQFYAAVPIEAQRMAIDPKAKKYQSDAFERKEPPRRTRTTAYAYHLEDERLSA